MATYLHFKDLHTLKPRLEAKGYVVEDIEKNDNFGGLGGVYIPIRKRGQGEKYKVLVEMDYPFNLGDVIACHKDLYDNQDYKNYNDDMWEE